MSDKKGRDFLRTRLPKLLAPPSSPVLARATDLPVTIEIPESSGSLESSSDNVSGNQKKTRSGYLRTIKRRGNTYFIGESLPSEEDPAEIDNTGKMLTDLYNDAIHLSSHASKQSTIFKTIYVLFDLFIVVAGVIIAVISYSDGSYYGATLGAIVSSLQTILTTFSIEKRGVLLRDVANKLRHVSRQIRMLQNSDAKPKAKLKELEKYYDQVDELDLSIFDNNITITPVSKNTEIKKDDSSEDDWYESHVAKKSHRSLVAKIVLPDVSIIDAMKQNTVK